MAYKKIDKDMRGNKITLEQEEKVVRLYITRKYSIRDIMKKTEVRSEQTIYRILSNYDVPLIRRKSVTKVSITLDEEAARILQEVNPYNVSDYVCEMIKKGSRL